MQCQSCGTILPTDAKYCPHCGVSTTNAEPLREAVPSSPVAQSDDKKWSPEALPYTPVPPTPEPASRGYEQVTSNPAGRVQTPANEAESPVYAPPKAPPPHRRGMSRRFMLILVVVALLIMASGIGLIYYTTVYHPNELHIQATVTAQAIQTQNAHTTATAETRATATAVAVANATATTQAHATTTATALQNIYTSATQSSPVLNDSLTSNSGNGWDEDLAVGGGGCAFIGGSYHASLYKQGFYFPCIARNTNFSNFAFQVQMTITKGDYGGLIFRGDGSTTKFYAFRVGTNGIYDLFSTQDSNHSTELAYGSSSSFKKNPGQTNLLTIIARGSNIYFYINKQYVGNVTDNAYKSGQIGFFAEDHTNPTDVTFNNAQVWKL